MAESKTLTIRPVKDTMYVHIKWSNGGQLPAQLEGFYTSSVEAQKAIDRYTTPKNAKASRTKSV